MRVLIETVDVRPFKELVNRLPTTHPMRVVINLEPDSIPFDEFVIKIATWLKLSKVKTSGD